MSSSSTCSAQRAAANRANSQKSTGPRTPQGKRAASQNASTHQAYCADLLQPGEPEPVFHAHRQAILKRLCPMDAVELCLAERFVSASWRLRRLQSADHHLALMEETDMRDEAVEQRLRIDELHQKAEELYLLFHRRDPQNAPGDAGANADADADPDDADLPDAGLPPEPLSPGLLIAHALRPRFGDPPYHNSRANSPFERLLAAEQRLQGMIHRALKELRALQSQRRDHPHEETCPVLTPDNDNDDNDDHDEHDNHSPAAQDPSPAPTPSAPHGATNSLQNKATCHNDSPAQIPAKPQKTEEEQPTTNPEQLTTATHPCKLPPVPRSTIENAP